MSDLLYAEFANMKSVMARFDAADKAAEKTIAAERIKRAATKAIRKEAPKGRTGELKRQIKGRLLYLPGGFDLTVASGAPYTNFVIEGRGWVYPIRAQALHWIAKSGEDVFAMSARPTEPNPFHERGWRKAYAEIERNWKLGANEMAYILAGGV